MWYNRTHGYGFVRCDELNEKLHVKRRQIRSTNTSERRSLLAKGQTVEFGVTDGFPLREAVSVVVRQETTRRRRRESVQTTSDNEVEKETTSTPEEELSPLGQLFDEACPKKVGNGSPLSQRGYRQRFENDP